MEANNTDPQDVQVVFKGNTYGLSVDLDTTTVRQFADDIAKQTGAERETVKLTVPGRKLLKVTERPEDSLRAAGIKAGMKLLVIASTHSEVQAVRNSRDLPGLAGFDQELRTLATRRRQSSATAAIKLPTGLHTFGQFEAWQAEGLSPPPSEALKLLHSLAADPGVAGVMNKHGWAVGKLSEMPPEGKVGVSPVCILGVNINAGQEISLRLRTDDLKGFRRYLSIRQTLCHELAHMVFGEHDLNFKRLNSQLCKECEELGRMAGVQLFRAAAGWDLDVPVDASDVMAATAASSGKTLRQLAGDAALPAGSALPLSRAASPSNQVQQRETEMLIAPEVQSLGHRDAATESKEAAAEQLGRLEPVQASQHQESQPLQPQASTLQAEESVQQNRGPINTLPLSTTDSTGPQDTEPQSAVQREQSASPSAPQEQVEQPESSAPARTEDTSEAMDVDQAGGVVSSPNDPSTAYFQDAQRALQTLVSRSEKPVAVVALQTLAKILKNALNNPTEAKYRRVRQQNPNFHTRVGQHPGSLELLRAAGYVPSNEGGEEVLVLSRNDPGLVWIALSACESALQSVSVQ